MAAALEEAEVVVEVGSSNFAGFLALLDDVPTADMTRWIGTGANHPPIPSTSAQRPYELRIPGVRILTPRRPYSTNISRTITVGGAGTTLTYSGTSAAPTAHSWVYVRLNSTGQGNLRKVTDHSTGPNVLTVSAAWSPALAADGTVHFLQDSATINTVDAALTTITRVTGALGGAGDQADFTSDVVGRHVLFFADDSVRKITAFTVDSITVDKPLASALTGGFCILTGPNSCQTMADLTDPAKSVLQDLTFYLDENAPVFLTGLDYPNFDTTPYQSPRVAYAGGPTINLTPELAFNLRSRLDSLHIIKMGISASMVSPFLNGQVYGPAPVVPYAGFTGWFHDILSLDFNPSSPSALYTATVNQIANIKALLLAENKVAKFRGLFINMTDNDPADAQRVVKLRANLELLISSLRTAIGDQTLPVSISGPSRYAGLDSQRELIYTDVLIPIAENDANVGVLDTRTSIDTGEGAAGDWTYPQDFAADALHFSATGQIKLGQGHGRVWETLQTIGATDVSIDICNLALSHIGHSAKVTSLDTAVDTSAEARHCARYFPRAVKMLMEQHRWDFNTRRKPLVLVTNQAANLLVRRTGEWAYAYDMPHLPPNFGGAIAVLPPGALRDAPSQPFVKESDLAGNVLIRTDVEDAVLQYNVTVMNARQWSESFKMAASWMLASLLAGPIIKGQEGRQAAKDCLAMLSVFRGAATTHDSNQRKVEPETDAPWI